MNRLIWSDSVAHLKAVRSECLCVCQGPQIKQGGFLGSLSSSRLWLHAWPLMISYNKSIDTMASADPRRQAHGAAPWENLSLKSNYPEEPMLFQRPREAMLTPDKGHMCSITHNWSRVFWKRNNPGAIWQNKQILGHKNCICNRNIIHGTWKLILVEHISTKSSTTKLG